MIFEKISKYFPFDQPYYLMPAQRVLTESLHFVDLRAKADEGGQSCKMMLDTSCVETDARMLDHSGITSSSQNDRVITTWRMPGKKGADVKCSEID